MQEPLQNDFPRGPPAMDEFRVAGDGITQYFHAVLIRPVFDPPVRRTLGVAFSMLSGWWRSRQVRAFARNR